MRRFYVPLQFLLVTFLIVGVGTTLASGYIVTCFFQGDSCSLGHDVATSLIIRGSYLLLFLLSLLALTLVARRDYLHHKALRQFSFAKPVEDLSPKDLGYREAKSGEQVEPRYRPFYEAYVKRGAKLGAGSSGSVTSYDESALVQELYSGTDFVILGPPLSGKSRTLYEVVKKLKGCFAVAPQEYGDLPDDKAFFELTTGKDVVLILEDLNDYVAKGFPLREFVRRLDHHAKSLAIAATCRDGPEMATIEAAQGTDASRFYEEIHLKLILVPLDGKEKENLARKLGKDWDPEQSEMYPTPGSIIMEDSMHAMQIRFEHALSPEQRDTLRTLHLLGFANVRPFTHNRIKLVLEHPDLFARTGVHLGDSLEDLTEQAFLHHPATQDPVDPELAYLLEAVEYTEGKTPLDDFPTLVEIFDTAADAEGLFYIAYIYKEAMEDRVRALDCLDRALNHRPDYPVALNNKGVELTALGRMMTP